jgi:hypothetical protein
MRSKSKQPIPEVGKQYHFFDDGKITPSRHSIATVLRVIPLCEAKDVFVSARDWNYDDPIYIIKPLVEIWQEDVIEHDWVMSKVTDYLIECSIPEYDDNNIWFARTTEGGWFSMDIQSGWQGGVLDVDGELYKYFLEHFPNYEDNIS